MGLRAEALLRLGKETREELLRGRCLRCRDSREVPTSPSPVFLAAAPSHCLPVSLLFGAVPARSRLPVPSSAPSQCSQTPSHLPCAHLCLQTPRRGRPLPRGISVCAGTKDQVTENLMWLDRGSCC